MFVGEKQALGPRAGARAAAAAQAAARDDATASRVRWVRTMADRIPTKWASMIGVGVFLAATASFGGLNSVAAPETPQVKVGERVITSNLEMTVDSAFLSDRVEDGITADKENGERVLAVRMRVTNLFPEARTMRGMQGLQNTRIMDGPDDIPQISRPGEAAQGALALQPGVPDEIILSWTVAASDYSEGDEVRIALSDPQTYRGQFLDDDLHWFEGGTSAVVTATLDDLGEGDPW